MTQLIQGPNFEMRMPPKQGAAAYKTYELRQPLQTHFRKATCQAVECKAYENGWQLGYDLSDPQKVEAANLVVRIAKQTGREFTHEILGSVVTFTFAAGTPCFETHSISLEREPLYIVRGGDWRGNPRKERRVHNNAENFVDDWAGHQDNLKTKLERG